MQRTKIEYLTHTWNPIAMRCTPVSDGCDHCWHLRMANRLGGNHIFDERIRNAYNIGVPWLLDKELSAPLKLRKPASIGVQFMGDLFHESIPFKWIAAIYGVMASCPQHTFFVLTKRTERMLKWFQWVDSEARDSKWTVAEPEAPWWKVHQCAIQANEILREDDIPTTAGTTWPLPNVLEGVSVENQKTADERIPLLLQTPAAKRWVSCEPALGEIILENNNPRYDYIWKYKSPARKTGSLDLVISGAETGHGARPCNPDWLRYVRDQCAAAGVPFFLKQINAKGDRELDGRKHEEMP